MSDLIEKMEEYLRGSNSGAYGRQHVKTKVRQHFGDKIIITDINGKQYVVTFRKTASAVLQDVYARRDGVDIDEQKMNIINTAAKLIKNNIKPIATSSVNYPTIATDAESHVRYLPKTLSAFLGVLFSEKNNSMKVALIKQAIDQATRPRVVIAPLQTHHTTISHPAY